jgi:hypothetical protein
VASDTVTQEDPQIIEVADTSASESARLNILNPPAIEQIIASQSGEDYLIEGLFYNKSINLLVGDSNLGKTPLAIQMCLCVAAGIPFLGKKVSQGPVLFIDFESRLETFYSQVKTISRFLGLPKPPDDFLCWSPMWERYPSEDAWKLRDQDRVLNRIAAVKPKLCVIDPLRLFWENAETQNESTVQMVKALKHVVKDTGSSIAITHHKRKPSNQVPEPDLITDPHTWLKEAAGMLSLVNQTDTRLGVDMKDKESDIVLGGYMRSVGALAPQYLTRVCSDSGDPLGYALLTGLELLNPKDKGFYELLPSDFKYKDVQKLIGSSSSNCLRFIRRCETLKLVSKDDDGYAKLVQAPHSSPAIDLAGWEVVE